MHARWFMPGLWGVTRGESGLNRPPLGLRLGSEPDHDLCLQPGQAHLKPRAETGPTATHGPVRRSASFSQPSQPLPPAPATGGPSFPHREEP